MPPGWSNFAAAVAIRGLYELTKQQAIQQRHFITENEFWNTPGQIVLTPIGVEQLFQAGVTDLLYVQQFAPPAAASRLVLNGRK